MDYTYDADNRIRKMFLMSDIMSKKTVCDIGCGKQQAKPILKELNPAAEYVGFDLYDHCPDTIVCDFNNSDYPPPQSNCQSETLTLLSGVLEYIYTRKLRRFISFIASISDACVLSYVHSDVRGSKGKIWVNDLSQIDILRLFRRAGFRLSAQCLHTMRDGTLLHGGGGCLYYFEKLHRWQKRHSLWRAMRLWL